MGDVLLDVETYLLLDSGDRHAVDNWLRDAGYPNCATKVTDMLDGTYMIDFKKVVGSKAMDHKAIIDDPELSHTFPITRRQYQELTDFLGD